MTPTSEQPTRATGAHARTPTFLFIGGQRCGSSWIHKCLEEHPAVFTAAPKEVHYFNRNFYKGPDWYLNHFTPGPEHKAWGEVTPDYIADPETPARAAALCPDAAVVAVLRDPIHRAHSIYQLKRDTSLNYPTFEEAIEYAPEIVDHGKYDEHLARWFEHFDKDQCLILLYDDLIRDERAVIQRVYRHIGVDPGYEPTWIGQSYNAVIMPRVRSKLRRMGLEPLVRAVKDTPIGDIVRKAHRRHKERAANKLRVSAETRDRLSEIYRPHNERLASLTGLDLSGWG